MSYLYIYMHSWFALIPIPFDFMSVLCTVHTLTVSFPGSALNSVHLKRCISYLELKQPAAEAGSQEVTPLAFRAGVPDPLLCKSNTSGVPLLPNKSTRPAFPQKTAACVFTHI